MNHTLKIGIGAGIPANGGIVRCRKITVRERILRLLFGEKRRLTIIVPGDNVKTLHILEEKEDLQ
jgi:hypothetical protein